MAAAATAAGVETAERVCSCFGKAGQLLRCKACLSAHYCDKACQTAHWKEHKPICKLRRVVADAATSGASSQREAQNLFVRSADWYKGLTPEEAYLRLIDSFRLRLDDDYTFQGDVCRFYGGESPLPDFKRYIRLMKQRQMMPPWWNSAHEAKLIKTALTHDFSSIKYAVEKGDIQDHYGKLGRPFEHFTLRMLASAVYGSEPWAF